MSSKITAYLKIKSRSSKDFVLKTLNYWLGVFDDKTKYDIIIYSEDIDLPKEYNGYNILRKNNLLDNISCLKLNNYINDSKLITHHWKGAFAALSNIYSYEATNDLIYNIDADDIIIYGPVKSYLRQVEELFQDPKMKTISSDLHLSAHIGDFYSRRPNHFSFGVNLSRRDFMKNLILKSIFKPIPDIGFGINLDYMIDKQLETIDTPYIGFVMPSLFSHQWGPGDNDKKTVRYDLQKNKIVSNLCGRIVEHDKHHKVILLK